MGSKTRRLRVAAGVAGLAHQADVRRAARSAARAGGSAIQFADGNRLESRGPKGPAVRSVATQDAHAELRARKARSNADFKRLLDEMAAHAAAENEKLQRGCVDPTLHRDTLQAAAVMGLALPRPLHVAEYLSPLDARAAAMGEVCRICGSAKPEVLTPLNRSDVEAMRAEVRTGEHVDEVLGEPFEGTIESVTIEGKRFDAVEPAAPPAPREPGMRRINRAAVPMALATLLAMASLGAVDDPKEER